MKAKPLSSFPLDRDPFAQLQHWYDEAVAAQIKQPDAMTLATATRSGTPSARIVLLKGITPEGISFYTNYQSRKGKELISNPKAALVFYWSKLDRQVRIEGKISKVSAEDSDAYWASRPRESCLSALASQQSKEISSREELEKRYHELTRKYEGQSIPRPKHWGGFYLIPHRFEFWIAGAHRLHDRFVYSLKKKEWVNSRLCP